MSQRGPRQVLAVYWQKRLVRILVAVVVLAGALFVQYRLANLVPLPVDVEKSGYTPARVKLGREELIIDNLSQPVVANESARSASDAFLSSVVMQNVVVEARFESSFLEKEFRDINDLDTADGPPTSPELIAYTTSSSSGKDDAANARGQTDNQYAPCQTLIEVSKAPGSNVPVELHFFQRHDPGLDQRREFAMTAVGADLIVGLTTKNSTDELGEMKGPGCAKTLEVGKWNESFSSPTTVAVVVPAGNSVRFTFTGDGTAPWLDQRGYYEPFSLLDQHLKLGSVRKLARERSPSLPAIFRADGVKGQPLSLDHLLVGAEEIQLAYSGEAMVQENGQFVKTFNLWKVADEHRPVALIFGMINLALVEWLRRIVFRSKSAARTKSGEELKQDEGGETADEEKQGKWSR